MQKRTLCRVSLVLLLVLAAPGFSAETDEERIENIYKAWVQAANRKDLERWSAFLAPDAYFSPADSTPLTTAGEILDYYRKSFADPEFSLDCQQQEVHVAESGEMAWSRGICRATFTNPEGRKDSGMSRWFKVWVKGRDGSWLGRVNAWKYVN